MRAMRCARSAWCSRTAIATSQPTGRKATGPFGLGKAGPWMRPVLVARGIDPDTEGAQLARYLVDELHARLQCVSRGAGAFRGGRHARRVAGGRTSTGPTRFIPAAPDSAGWPRRSLASGARARSFPAGVSTDARRTTAPGARSAAGDAARQGRRHAAAARAEACACCSPGHSGKNTACWRRNCSRAELSVDLFQIDLDRIVSKYVARHGEESRRAVHRRPRPRTPCCCSTTPDHLFGERSQRRIGPLSQISTSPSCGSASKPTTASCC